MPRALLLLLVFAGTSFAQIDALRAEIRAAYIPDPSQPGRELVRARDLFTAAKTKPNRSAYIEALRAELEDSTNSPTMRADGCARLLFLSDTLDDRILAARVLARSNAQQVGIISYYAIARQLSDRNVDTSLAAFQLLEYPDLSMRFVQDFSFNQMSLVASLLLATDQKYWADSAVERLASEQDETAQQTLLNLLWYAQTDFADAELAAFAHSAKKPAASRALAEELLARGPNLTSQDRLEVLATSEEELRESRRRHQVGLYFKNIMPTMQRDTMKILLKRRLTASDSGPARR